MGIYSWNMVKNGDLPMKNGDLQVIYDSSVDLQLG